MCGCRRELLKQLQPFRHDTVFKLREPRDVASRPGHAFNYAQTNRIDRLREYNRHATARLLQRQYRDAGCGERHVWTKRHQLYSVGTKTIGIAFTPPVVDVQVASDNPAILRQTL